MYPKKIASGLIFTVILLIAFWFIIFESKAPEKAKAQTTSTIAFLGDARTTSSEHTKNPGITASINLLRDDINQIKPQSPTGNVNAVFMIGDFDKVSDTQKAWKASSINNTPHYYVMGNHEIDDDDPSYVRNLFPYSNYGIPLNPGPAGTSKTTYSMNIGNIHVVNVNVYWNGSNNDTSGSGFIPDALYNWIKTDLTNTTAACKVVMLHEPLYPLKRHVGDSLDANKPNRDKFQQLLVDKKVNVLVAAHTHYAAVQNKGGVYHIDTGVSGPKTADGEDSFASIFYTHTNGNNLILTWKRENPTWSSPKVTTYTSPCASTSSTPTPTPGGPTPTSQQPTPTSAPTPTGTYASSCDGQTTMTDHRDSQVYDIAQIGSQCWMAENLNYGTRINGLKSGSINDQADPGKIEKYCWEDNSSNCATYGGYYQWHEAVQLPISCDSSDCSSQITYPQQGICPSGWHIPSDVQDNASPASNNDWYTLENYLKNSGQSCSATRDDVWSCAGAGTKMKTGGGSRLDLGLFGSIMNNGRGYIDMGIDGHYWSSGATQYSGTNNRVWARDFDSNNDNVKRKAKEKNRGFPVRCVKNSSAVSPTPGQDTTPTVSQTPTPQPVTPTIYCLGSCNNPTAAPSDQPLPSDGPTPAAPTAIPPAPTAIAIVVIIAVILILFRIAVLR